MRQLIENNRPCLRIYDLHIDGVQYIDDVQIDDLGQVYDTDTSSVDRSPTDGSLPAVERV